MASRGHFLTLLGLRDILYDGMMITSNGVSMKSLFLLAVLSLNLLESTYAFRKSGYNGSFTLGSREQGRGQREHLIGYLIRERLNDDHYTQKKLDDSLSEKAFDKLFERFDPGRHFFLQSDIDKLSKYRFKLDDHIDSGEYELLDKLIVIYNKRLEELDSYRNEVFKEKFTFKGNETLETDPDKREYAKTLAELKSYWRRFYKQSVLRNYIASLEGQKKLKEDKKKNDKKKKQEKKLTDREMRDKAHKSVNKKYGILFARLKKDSRMNHFEKFINAVVGIYDPHSNYISPRKKEDLDIKLSGQLVGIGAVLEEDGQFIKVVRIISGGAAWHQKELEAGDIILMAGEGDGDPTDLVNMGVDDAVRYIRGKKGTIVKLTVKKVNGGRKVIALKRDVVQIEETYAKGSVLEQKNLGIRVGYIKLPTFYRDVRDPSRSCSRDVLMELKRLKKQRIDGVILDLRGNLGGALFDAKVMSGFFIDKGPIVQVRRPNDGIDVLKDRDPEIFYDGPLIVMVNQGSASASEILAGAMQDYGRAVIVGAEKTFGKGTVQEVGELTLAPSFLSSGFHGPLGAIKITIQQFYRITGVSTQFKGIVPDIILPNAVYVDKHEQDLDYAIPWGTVKPLLFTKWNKFSYDIPLLKKKSAKRVKRNKNFQKVEQGMNYLLNAKEDTLVSLNLKKVLQKDEQIKKKAASFKIEEEDKNIIVSNFEESLMAHEKIDKSEIKRWKQSFEQRKKEWVKSLTKDPMIGETLFIMGDMIENVKFKKFSNR